MRRLARWLAAFALLAAGAGPGPALAAPAPPPVPGSALEPGSNLALQVSGVRTGPSELGFFLAASGLPDGVSLMGSAISVRAQTIEAGGKTGTTELDTSVAPVSGLANQPDRAVAVLLQVSGDQVRLNAVTAAVARYVVASPAGVAFGLVALDHRPTTILAPTTDRDDFIAALQGVRPTESDDLSGAVAQADSLLTSTPGSAQYRSRRILAVVAGPVGAAGAGIEATAAQLDSEGRPLDAVGFGVARSVDSPLALLTGATGGRLRTVGSPSALREALDESAAWLDTAVTVACPVPADLSGKSVKLQVTARISGAAAGSATTPVRFAVDPAAVAAAPEPARVATGRGPLLPVALVAIAAVIVWAGVAWLVPAIADSEGKRAMARLQRILDFRSGGRRSRFSPAALAATASDWAGRVLLRGQLRRARIELSLERAGSTLTPDQWLAARIGVGVATFFVFAILMSWWAGLILGILAGWAGTGYWLRSRAAKRSRAFAEQLPDALRVVVGSLRSGFSLHQAIDSVAGEGDGPVAVEFRRALAEIRLGGDLEEGLERVADRNNSRDVRWLVMALRIQSDVGGSLAEVVETTVATMRERARLERTVRALSAEGRLSAVVLVMLPIGVGGFMFLVRRPYIRPLYTTTMGLCFLVASIVMIVVGWIWMRKLVKVEV